MFLVNDATILIRDMAGDAAQKAANKVNPSEDQLNQIDHAAPDNTWHDTPDMSSGNIKQNAHPGGSRDPTETAALASQDQQQGTSSGVNAQAGAQAGISTLRDRASDNIPQETKDQARINKERTKNYLKSKMPEDRRDQTIWRLRKMVVEIQGHPDCKSIPHP
jgi:hypothetical protein